MISVSLWLWWYDRAWQCLCSCFSSSSFLKLSSVLKLAPKLWIGGPSCAPHSRAMPASFPSPTGGSGIWIFLMMTTSWRPWLYFQVWEVHLRSVIHTLVRHPHQLPGRGHHQQVGHHNHQHDWHLTPYPRWGDCHLDADTSCEVESRSDPQDTAQCVTQGGPSSNRQCVFPFTHDGKNDPNLLFWCSMFYFNHRRCCV